ncbi:uncharacterized protein L201_006723 [Kwoniella dendrophila CBS 6074]|uniref:FAD/NAD(P)-binding domain-containing protein n=1 Tax=Kwoniella dendrophila CBS 6074 TaxID=1295534 RepID=A0AAX4K2H0_9TREE
MSKHPRIAIIGAGYMKENQVQEAFGTKIDTLVVVDSDGISIENGKKYQADYIVLATGFDTAASLEREGRDGNMMRGKKDHLRYYHGIAIPGFPNFFSLQGNNSTPGHFSALFQLETQATYIASMLSQSLTEGDAVIEVNAKATENYNQWIDDGISKTVWNDKESWFHADGGKGRVFTHWPGPATLYWWINRKIDRNDWIFTKA